MPVVITYPFATVRTPLDGLDAHATVVDGVGHEEIIHARTGRRAETKELDTVEPNDTDLGEVGGPPLDGATHRLADRAACSAGRRPDDRGREPGAERFPFRFAPPYRALARPFGITPSTSWVTVTADRLEATFGPWRVATPIANIERVELTGPYHLIKTAGPARLSLADAGLTFATNGDRGVHVTFHQPITGADPLGRIHSPDLTLTVADCPSLVAELIRRQQ